MDERRVATCFSALQRAENSSIRGSGAERAAIRSCFSALQRAENSSISCARAGRARSTRVSVLFSEPKIPQYCEIVTARVRLLVSVLFSEPKIPQFHWRRVGADVHQVSVLFSEPKIPQSRRKPPSAGIIRTFQCSSASRKFLNPSVARVVARAPSFSALQRAENSSMMKSGNASRNPYSFQCSSASRKFLNRREGA